jgi:hypothetical protein
MPSAAPLGAPVRETVAPASSEVERSGSATPVVSERPDATSTPAAATGDATPVDDVEAAVDWRAFVPTDQADHLATMDRAARESNCGVPWQLLAAIARVESDFGRNMATSSAGAIGYGQFLPSSWQAFGSDGNAYDYRDALPAIALYLCQAGLERDPRAALFAYNHADWYVDLVLDLAARYDRMAPGAPTPAVLGVAPADAPAPKIEYASGRDVRLQNRPRSVSPDVRWLGVPWRGRTAGEPIAARALAATTLRMVRLAYGLPDTLATISAVGGSVDPDVFANAAWDAGLLNVGSSQPQWTMAELRRHLRLGQPVVVFVGRTGLPGHPPDEDDGEQPLVLVGTTSDGLIYNDPTFSSSLGYGLEVTEADLVRFWDTAARPRQALAFVARPKPFARQAHVAEAQLPEPLARELPTVTPVPTATLLPRPTPLLTRVTTAVSTPDVAAPVATAPLAPSPPPSERTVPFEDWSGLVFGALAVAVIALRRLRGGPPR